MSGNSLIFQVLFANRQSNTGVTITSQFTQDLLAAKAEGLARLLKIMRESANETQIRLAAAAILRIRVEEPKEPAPAVDETADSAPTLVYQRLTPPEVAELSQNLPRLSPARFHDKRAAGYWRGVLDTQRYFHSIVPGMSGLRPDSKAAA